MKTTPVEKYLGTIPHRLQLAGGWIDQPFVSRHNPRPPGSMVVVPIEPDFQPMERSGIASGTRAVAMKLWKGRLPDRRPEKLVQELYEAENKRKAELSGSQDMIGLVYPGVNRLDYDYKIRGGVFPAHIESCNRRKVAQWLSSVLHLIPVEPRPIGYGPLGMKQLRPEWIAKLGQSGRDCYDAIVKMDAKGLGAALNLNMKCWESLLPHTVRHPLLRKDLMPLLKAYQRQYPGAMYSGCGGGYIIAVSNQPVPGAFQVNVRVAKEAGSPKQIVVSGGFDDIKSRDIRFLEEAAKLGPVTVLLWTDSAIKQDTGCAPKFPIAERYYFLDAIRYVSRVVEVDNSDGIGTMLKDFKADVWADTENAANSSRRIFAAENQIAYRVFMEGELSGFPKPPPMPVSGRKKVVVTGSFDWVHSGHVRFLEEAGILGDLYVVVGHDANIRLLKGEGHPLLSEDERRYMVGSVKFVRQALISTGKGWLDAAPEIRRLNPEIYVVNQDGDKGDKREYCAKRGMKYIVLKRTPAPGLPTRSSTDLRGF